MPTITFLPAGLRAEYREGESIFEVGRRSDIAIETSCVGKATCGLCRVKIVAGEEFLNPLTDDETKHLGNVYFVTKVRLSCQTRPAGGDVVVQVAGARKRRGVKPARGGTEPPRG